MKEPKISWSYINLGRGKMAFELSINRLQVGIVIYQESKTEYRVTTAGAVASDYPVNEKFTDLEAAQTAAINVYANYLNERAASLRKLIQPPVDSPVAGPPLAAGTVEFLVRATQPVGQARNGS